MHDLRNLNDLLAWLTALQVCSNHTQIFVLSVLSIQNRWTWHLTCDQENCSHLMDDMWFKHTCDGTKPKTAWIHSLSLKSSKTFTQSSWYIQKKGTWENLVWERVKKPKLFFKQMLQFWSSWHTILFLIDLLTEILFN